MAAVACRVRLEARCGVRRQTPGIRGHLPAALMEPLRTLDFTGGGGARRHQCTRHGACAHTCRQRPEVSTVILTAGSSRGKACEAFRISREPPRGTRYSDHSERFTGGFSLNIWVTCAQKAGSPWVSLFTCVYLGHVHWQESFGSPWASLASLGSCGSLQSFGSLSPGDSTDPRDTNGISDPSRTA